MGIRHDNNKKILKMKIFMALTALVAGTSIVSSDTKAGCACCFGSISCCAICCVTKCRDDSVLTGKVANLLDEVQMGLSEAQTESCGKCQRLPKSNNQNFLFRLFL